MLLSHVLGQNEPKKNGLLEKWRNFGAKSAQIRGVKMSKNPHLKRILHQVQMDHCTVVLTYMDMVMC